MCGRWLEESVWSAVLDIAESVTPSRSKSQSCRVVKTEHAVKRADCPFAIDIIQSCRLALAAGAAPVAWVGGWWRHVTSCSLKHNDVIGEPVYVSTAAATHKQATIQRRRVGMLL